jgi:hypothetical protein
MKKIIILLLFIPLLSIGQTEALKTLFYHEMDNQETSYEYGTYNNEESIIKIIEKHKEKTFGRFYTVEEMSFKGKDVNSPTVTGIKDGWTRKYEEMKEKKHFGKAIQEFYKYINTINHSKDLLCSEIFFICNNEVYRSEYSCSDFIHGTLSRMQGGIVSNVDIEEFDLELMVNIFLDDLINNNAQMGYPIDLITSFGGIFDQKNSSKRPKIRATFVPLDGDALALSYGFNDDKNIVLKVDPEKWAKASSAKRWYTLYHELGHDVLNFEHGQGGKMMFNFADIDYNWKTFEKDRNYMFKKYLSK